MTPRQMLAASLAFVAVGVWLVVTGGWLDRVFGVAAVLLFGLCVYAAVDRLTPGRRSAGPPDPLPAQVRSDGWFPDHEPEETRLSPQEADLLDALRAGARSLPSAGARSFVVRDFIAGEALTAVVSVRDGTELLAVGLHLEGGRLRGPTDLAAEASAPPGECDLERAVDWLDGLLRRPVERLEWWRRGQLYAARYQFADTAEGLVEAFEPRHAPPGPRKALGAPDVVIAVRADGRQFATPPMPKIGWRRCTDAQPARPASPAA